MMYKIELTTPDGRVAFFQGFDFPAEMETDLVKGVEMAIDYEIAVSRGDN